MPTKKSSRKKTKTMSCGAHGGGCGGAFYFLGALGAAIYFISAVSGFWPTVLAILKALIWPLFLVLKLFAFISA